MTHCRFLVWAAALALSACGGQVMDDELEASSTGLTAAEQRGKDTWFKATFGGEKFFSVIAPNQLNLHVGLDAVLLTPRAVRFDVWGVINDPDCVPDGPDPDPLDDCLDPGSSGIIGVRRSIVQGPNGPQLGIGVACAGCHAGFDPANPPANPNAPTWDNIHATVGNQYVEIGKIFAAHIPENDPRWQVFHSWAPGTVDTTAIESDGINNPGIVTQFWNVPDRPFFNLTDEGKKIRVHRGGQGGEDDAGCEKAALRVYFNIGMCAAECMLPALATGTEIDIPTCRERCPEFVQAEAAVVEMCQFMGTTTSPKLLATPGGRAYVDRTKVARGKQVFAAACASCHSNGKHLTDRDVLSNDEVLPAAIVGTNSCRSKTTNWMEGKIWGQFSSDQYKARPTGGPGFYRNVPLQAVWATAPFFHNNRLGKYTGDPSVAGRMEAYEDAMWQLLHPLQRDFQIDRTTTAIDVGLPFKLPKGTPVALFANLDKATGELRCGDLIENGGHTFGWWLSESDKRALTEYLKTR